MPMPIFTCAKCGDLSERLGESRDPPQCCDQPMQPLELDDVQAALLSREIERDRQRGAQ